MLLFYNRIKKGGIVRKFLVLLLLGITLLGSEKLPAWYLNPPLDDNVFWFGVGEGSTLRQAKDSALADIAAKLSVTISSKVSKSSTQSTSGVSSVFHQDVKINLESEVKKISFSSFETVDSVSSDSKTMVLVKVQKVKFFKDQKQILMDSLTELDRIKSTAANKSILEQYQIFKNFSPEADKAKIIASVLSSFDVEYDRQLTSTKLSDYDDSIDDARSKIEFYINADRNSRYCADILKEALAKEKIKTTKYLNKNNRNLVVVDLDTDVTSREMYGSFMTKARTTVSLKSKDNSILSTFIVESKGSSSLDEAASLKNSSMDFKKQVAEKGVFDFLGIN